MSQKLSCLEVNLRSWLPKIRIASTEVLSVHSCTKYNVAYDKYNKCKKQLQWKSKFDIGVNVFYVGVVVR